MCLDLRRLVALTALLPVLALAACGGSGERDSDADRACTAEIAPAADPAATPPANVPTPEGAIFFDVVTQGQTTAYYAKVAGDSVTETRDAIDTQLRNAGYTIEGTDQEEDAEAEAEFSGPHDGRLQVRHLCEGTLRVRVILEN